MQKRGARKKGFNPAQLIPVALSLLVGVGVFFLGRALMARHAPIPVPKSFALYTSPDHTFVCQPPTAWAQDPGKTASGAAQFGTGGALITISESALNALAGDVARSHSAFGEAMSPLQRIHDAEAHQELATYPDYVEAQTHPYKSPMGSALFAEFTATGDWRIGRLHGYHVTMLGPEREVTLFCQCPDSDWPTLKPVFDYVINSVRPIAPRIT